MKEVGKGELGSRGGSMKGVSWVEGKGEGMAEQVEREAVWMGRDHGVDEGGAARQRKRWMTAIFLFFLKGTRATGGTSRV